ncbi:hypothetical protein ALC57_17670, partial [Trachymyrmex cornetzi]
DANGALPRRKRLGPACSKAAARRAGAPLVAPEDSAGPPSRTGSCASLESLAGESCKRPATVVISSPGSDRGEDSAKRSRALWRYGSSAIAKAVKKSKNLKGTMVRDLWDAFRDRREERAWAEEKRLLLRENRRLLAEKAKLERGRDKSPLPCRGKDGSARGEMAIRREVLPMDISGPNSSAGARSPVLTRDRAARWNLQTRSPPPAPVRLLITEEDFRQPWYRPAVGGTSRQMNPQTPPPS